MENKIAIVSHKMEEYLAIIRSLTGGEYHVQKSYKNTCKDRRLEGEHEEHEGEDGGLYHACKCGQFNRCLIG